MIFQSLTLSKFCQHPLNKIWLRPPKYFEFFNKQSFVKLIIFFERLLFIKTSMTSRYNRERRGYPYAFYFYCVFQLVRTEERKGWVSGLVLGIDAETGRAASWKKSGNMATGRKGRGVEEQQKQTETNRCWIKLFLNLFLYAIPLRRL